MLILTQKHPNFAFAGGVGVEIARLFKCDDHHFSTQKWPKNYKKT